MRRITIVALLLLSVAVAAVVSAEDAPKPITVASFFKVVPGKGDTVMGLIKKYDKPVMDKLMADGTIAGWGVGMPWAHTNGSWNLVFWVDAPDWASHGKVDQAFEAAEKARSTDENKKIEQEFHASTVADAHRDLVYRQVAGKMGKAPANPDGKGYLWLANWTAKPGKEDDLTSFLSDIYPGVFDKLVADGVIGGYGILVPIVHVAGAPTHLSWYWVDTLGGIDKVQAALRAAHAKRSAEQQASLEARAAGIFEPGTHSDDLLEVPLSAVK